MAKRSQKPPRQKNQTEQLLDDSDHESDEPQREHFGARQGKLAEQAKIERTAVMRSAAELASGAADTLPVGEVIQVYSRYYRVTVASETRLCVARKTMTKLAETGIVVGDQVRFRDGKPGEECVIEQVLPRRTILTRTDSFNPGRQHPIVANAKQMLIVASLIEPAVKWGLVDRMIVAARSGGLDPIVCLNKIDLPGELDPAGEVLTYYTGLGIRTLKTSVAKEIGLADLTALLKDNTTVLAGHSGVGKSSLIAAIQPGLDIRIGEVSQFTAKGKHTTTSARRYDLAMGGCVIDTPGVKLFGLWNVSLENLNTYFPDIKDDTAPAWRRESYQRIADSLTGADNNDKSRH